MLSPGGGPLISASAVPHRWEDRFEHPRLAEVVPNCLVAFYDTRSESSGTFYYPIPAGGCDAGRPHPQLAPEARQLIEGRSPSVVHVSNQRSFSSVVSVGSKQKTWCPTDLTWVSSDLVECMKRTQAEILLKTIKFVDRTVQFSVHKTLNSSRRVIRRRELIDMTEIKIR